MNEKKWILTTKDGKLKSITKENIISVTKWCPKEKKYETQENYYTLCSKIIPRTKLLHKGKKTQKEKMEKRTSKNELWQY